MMSAESDESYALQKTVEEDVRELRKACGMMLAGLTGTNQRLAITEQELAESKQELAVTNQRLAKTEHELAETKQQLAETMQVLGDVTETVDRHSETLSCGVDVLKRHKVEGLERVFVKAEWKDKPRPATQLEWDSLYDKVEKAAPSIIESARKLRKLKSKLSPAIHHPAVADIDAIIAELAPADCALLDEIPAIIAVVEALEPISEAAEAPTTVVS